MKILVYQLTLMNHGLKLIDDTILDMNYRVHNNMTLLKKNTYCVDGVNLEIFADTDLPDTESAINGNILVCAPADPGLTQNKYRSLTEFEIRVVKKHVKDDGTSPRLCLDEST